MNGVIAAGSATTRSLSAGNRFPKTATAYSGAGISLSRSAVEGQSGHWSAGGRKVRVCRCTASATHSSVSGS